VDIVMRRLRWLVQHGITDLATIRQAVDVQAGAPLPHVPATQSSPHAAHPTLPPASCFATCSAFQWYLPLLLGPADAAASTHAGLDAACVAAGWAVPAQRTGWGEQVHIPRKQVHGCLLFPPQHSTARALQVQRVAQCCMRRVLAGTGALAAEGLLAAAVVEDLRKQRRGMVQTLDQYYFCYRTIMEELRSQL
jgi:hypothetical protein